MKVETLDIFCKVVEQGSISQVADELFISQPAISRKIRGLEETYTVQLFERNKGHLVITKEGEALYELAKEIVNKYHYSFEILNDLKEKSNPNLRIGSSLTIGEYLLPSLLGEFKKKSPKTDIKLDITSTPKIMQSLKNDKIDIALVEGEVSDTQFIVQKFYEDELIVVCSSNQRWNEVEEISLQELSKERMIGREANSGTRQIIEKALFETGEMTKIDMYMELGSTQAIKKAVEIDLGIAILSNLAVENEVKNGSLKKLSIQDFSLKRNLWIVQNKRKLYRSIEKEFQRYILKQVEQENSKTI